MNPKFIIQDNNLKLQYIAGILIKETSFFKSSINQYYINKYPKFKNHIIAFNLKCNDKKSVSVKEAKEYLAKLVPTIQKLNIKFLYVCDPVYFKILTKTKKLSTSYGYVLNCTLPELQKVKIILGIDYSLLFYNPVLETNYKLSIKTLYSCLTNDYTELGQNVIHSAEYITEISEMVKALECLHKYPQLTLDIETFSLDHTSAGIATVAFAWNEHNGIAISCDHGLYNLQNTVKIKRAHLKKFLLEYKGTLIYHNACYDIKILIYVLFMQENSENYEGMVEGLNKLTTNIHDTKLITYLAKNSVSRISLSLKDNTHEFTGKYAIDEIKNIHSIDIKSLLKYNLIDALATWYLYQKEYPNMVKDQQLDIYNKIFKPSIKVIIQMELIGLPVNINTLQYNKEILQNKKYKYQKILLNNKHIIKYTEKLRIKLKLQTIILNKKRNLIIEGTLFNPASSKQLGELLYDHLNLPILQKTNTGKPSVAGKVLEWLEKQTVDIDSKEILKTINALNKVSKILSTFIEPMILKAKRRKKDEFANVYGNFNIGGTISGRLSSSNIDLQNLPNTGTIYGKQIKQCVQPPKGWVIVGVDFSSLEDKISALITNDPNKQKVYIDKYDGHCLRAYSYFKENMPDIENTVKSINSIKQRYPKERQNSKAPTFALTYAGTYKTLINNIGLDPKVAIRIEKEYHKLYKVADDWVKNRLIEACKTGYITVAFGLRLRTLILQQTFLNKPYTPYEAAAESRSAGNAMGQSYGMLNNRAAIEFQELTLASNYKYLILPFAHIHDAQYFLVKDDVHVIKWVNDNLIKCVKWQNLPELKHPDIKLGGELIVYHPDWNTGYVIKNNASIKEMRIAVKRK